MYNTPYISTDYRCIKCLEKDLIKDRYLVPNKPGECHICNKYSNELYDYVILLKLQKGLN